MKKLEWNFSLVLLVLLLAFSFAPVLQLTIIYANSLLFVSSSEYLFQSRDVGLFNTFNVIGVLLSFIGFVYLRSFMKYKIIFLCFYVFFAIPLITLNTGEEIYNNTPYFLPSLIHSVVVVLPIFLAELYQK